MALADLGGIITYPQYPWGGGAPGLGTRALDAATEGCGWVILAPKSGDIASVYFRTGTVTTGADLDIRLETVSGGPPALPTGTLWGTDTAKVVTVASSDDNVTKEAVLTAEATVVAGNRLAIIAYAPDGYAGNMLIGNFHSSWGWTNNQVNYEVTKLTGSWARNTGVWGPWAVKYDDGVVYPLDSICPPNTIAFDSWGNNSTPDERGLLISLPFAARATGIVVRLDSNDVGVEAVLYDSSNNVLAAGDNAWFNGAGDCVWRFAPVELDVGDYRVVMKPTSTSQITVPRFTVSAAALRGGFPGGLNCQYTSRTDAGAWTNSTTQWMHAALMLDQLDDGAGGGGGGARGSLLHGLGG